MVYILIKVWSNEKEMVRTDETPKACVKEKLLCQ
jgi:hypothetical protein